MSARAHALALRTAGLDALSAGAADAGIEQLRSAAAAAHDAHDPELEAEALLDLGIALVHAVQGYDDEGSVVLRGAVAVASEANLDGIASRALAELGYVDVIGGRPVTAVLHLDWARELAGNDQALLASVASIEATGLHDRGQLDLAVARFREAAEYAVAAGKTRRHAWVLGLGARTLYWQGEYAEARAWVESALELIQRERWTAFRPWVEAWRGQIDLTLGRDPGEVIAELESTYALSCQLKDACWQGISAKVMGLAHAASGDRAARTRGCAPPPRHARARRTRMYGFAPTLPSPTPNSPSNGTTVRPRSSARTMPSWCGAMWARRHFGAGVQRARE